MPTILKPFMSKEKYARDQVQKEATKNTQLKQPGFLSNAGDWISRHTLGAITKNQKAKDENTTNCTT